MTENQRLRVRLAETEAQRDAHAQTVANLSRSTIGRILIWWNRFADVHEHRVRLAGRPAAALRYVFMRSPLRSLRPSPLFDAGWYAAAHPEASRASSPWRHYVRRGIKRGLQPNAFFDPDWYLEQYPDIRRWRDDPLGHYELYGAAEGRVPRA